MKPSKTTDKQFSLWLGEVLQPEKRTHSTFVTFEGTYHKIYKCSRCGKTFAVTDASEDDTCLYINPIPLDDWNVAMKFFRAIGDEFPGEIKKVIREIFYNAVDDGNEAACALACFGEDALEANVSVWFNFYATERDFLQAAAELKLNQE